MRKLSARTKIIPGLATAVLAVLGSSNMQAQAAEQPMGSDPLLSGFMDPPNSARPRVWWHWMNGNITQDGIRQDMQWMQRVGIGGLQNFDANLMTPQIVQKRLAYMTPEWRDAFRYAATLADSLGLELAIASSPGWSETGGPWVQPQDGLKKVVWSETQIRGGHHFSGKLAAPPAVSGPFQSIPIADPMGMPGEHAPAPPRYYADTVVLAYPAKASAPMPVPQIATGTGKSVDGAPLRDDDPTTTIDVDRGSGADPALIFTYPSPQTIRSVNLYIPGVSIFGTPSMSPRLESSNDGKAWRQVADVPMATVPTTVSFAAVKARQFRLVFAAATARPFRLGDPAPGVAGVEMMAALTAPPSGPIKVAELQLSPEAKVDRFEAKAGFSIERDYYALGLNGAEDLKGIPPDQVIDLSAHLKPDGTLDWSAPKGQWRILRLGYSLLGTTNHPATSEATGLEVDKFDAAAVRSYLETYLNMYIQTVGPALMGEHGVRALLTDSIEVGAANWTAKLIEQFKRLRGYDPTPWLPALTGVIVGSRSASDNFLYDYRRTFADLIASEHYGTVATVAHEHGLKVYGEALEDGRPSLGDDMTMRSHADVPMSAMWTYPRELGPKPTYLADVKGAASVAHIYGQNVVAAESMTSAMAPWAYAPHDLRRVIDLEFATGVNRPVIHTSVHQPVDDKIPGLSLFIFGQYFNRHETWAEMARPWVDYIARNSYLLQQGRNVADVAYFYGEEAPLTGLYGETPVADAPTHYAYDFVSADALLHHLHVDKGALVANGGARYKVLYLGGSSRHMTLSTLQQLASLVEAGATLVGDAPDSSPSLNDDKGAFDALMHRLWSGAPVTMVGRGSVIAGNDIEGVLGKAGLPPDFSYTTNEPDSAVLFLHRQLAEGDLYFIDNRLARAEHLDARFRVRGKLPELWHADTGKVERVSYRVDGDHTLVPLDLAPDESTFVVFRTSTDVGSGRVEQPNLSPVQTLAGPWNVSFQAHRGAPDQLSLPSLASLSEQSDPGVKYFSGVATYSQDIVLPKDRKVLALDLGQVCDLAEVSLNGVSLGTAWHAPFRLDVGGALKPGRNRLEIRVADLWVNRLIGDAQPDANKLTWTSMPSYRADAPLRCSGLVGPVTLLAAKSDRP